MQPEAINNWPVPGVGQLNSSYGKIDILAYACIQEIVT